MKYGKLVAHSPQLTVRKSFIGINKTKIFQGFRKYFMHKLVLWPSFDAAPSRSDPSAWWRSAWGGGWCCPWSRA